MRIRWARILLWTFAAVVVVAGLIVAGVWLRLRGTPVHASVVDPARVAADSAAPQVLRDFRANENARDLAAPGASLKMNS